MQPSKSVLTYGACLNSRQRPSDDRGSRAVLTGALLVLVAASLSAAAAAESPAGAVVDDAKKGAPADQVGGRRLREKSQEQRTSSRLTAAQAKALALKAHAEAAAMDRLPKFFYRVKSGNGDVDTMRNREECSIEGLKEALDGPVAEADWLQWGVILGWTESRVLRSEGEREGKSFGNGTDTWRRDRVWTKELAFERTVADGDPTQFYFCAPDQLWGGVLRELAYFRVSPHHFWWATSDEHDDNISLVPPEEADYRFITREPFDHEICDVVESPSRAERLWIGRESGRLRGVLVISRYRGDGSEEPFFQHARVEKIAGKRFNTQQEYVEWIRGKAITERQKIEIARAWCELNFDLLGPNELIRFRDYREIAPGVWIPFREDRAFTHGADGNAKGHKYIRLWVAVEEVQTDVDLTERVESLRPKEAQRIQDQRFGVAVDYEYRRDRTRDDILKLVEAERQKRKAHDDALAARRAMQKLVGSSAPELSGKVWLNTDKPPTWRDFRGKPVLLVWFDLKQPSFLPLVPPLLEFHHTYGAKGLQIIGVHVKDAHDEVAMRLTEVDITFPVLIDDGKTAERFASGLSCLLIDRDGKVVSVYKDSLAPPAEIEKLLVEKYAK
jgi:hypothetical protein